MHVINLLIGDPSQDGHGKLESVCISSNLTREELVNAYDKGSKKLGFDFTESVAVEYEDSTLSDEVYEKLKAAGIEVESDTVGESDRIIWSSSYLKIYLAIVKLGNQKFKHTFLDNSLHIGGYGLFE